MFTGIIQAVGKIAAIEKKRTDCKLKIEVSSLDMSLVNLGDSIAVNGVCLTAVEFNSNSFTADVSNETLSLTTLGDLTIGAPVNLEKALSLSTPLGGHLVSGHVDGVGKILKRTSDGRSERFFIEAPAGLAKYIAQKGSVCIDGISLTVNGVNGAIFDLNIVPHTLQKTTIGQFQSGQSVNLEVDLLARYLERLMMGEAAATPNSSGALATGLTPDLTGGLTESFLKDNGFVR